ncbi:MAG TPA: Spy/CpxP family protein refolding chaperone [Thermoanaerobaculia bacterium]|nr:Spy/CpxP family protein refolding chaperone [Thermoanaerobaculia bacterium]
MKRTLITILVLTTIAGAAVAAPRGGRPGGPPPDARGGDLPPGVLAEFLGLTEAQTAQIDALRETLRTTTEPLHEQLRANREEMRAAVEAGDAAKAGALAVAGHQLAEQVKAARDTFRAGVENVLTAEQKTKFAVYQELMELRRERGPRPPRD